MDEDEVDGEVDEDGDVDENGDVDGDWEGDGNGDGVGMATGWGWRPFILNKPRIWRFFIFFVYHLSEGFQ